MARLSEMIGTTPQAAAPAAGGPARPPLKVIHLSRSIVTHQGDTRVLSLREPTLADYIEFGDIDTPVATDFEDGRATVLRTHTYRDALISWAVALTGLDRIVLGALSAQDAGAVFEAVRIAVEPFSKGSASGNSQSAPTSSSSSSDLTQSLSLAHR